MSDEPPTPPASLPTEIVDALDEATAEHLRDAARYAEALAEHREREGRVEADANSGEVAERPDDRPDDIPAKATVTIKEINDNRYYYWQWREGEKIRSQYKGPVNPDE
ncbi:uncharacterized protein HHUB_4210 (plasmid) [Halobacterium hubeiense]|uniref:DUF6788 domain-containing protein n=2 Tax=Halobacterium hubeiense TaxID=1407499 RepID=A0A0U5H8J7_9EURY|nr:hypothetical protein [Halobacterium hubeiense]CQH63865.1 uncharacterized protein HHUB_4210 [Halobacterium hubeiense]